MPAELFLHLYTGGITLGLNVFHARLPLGLQQSASLAADGFSVNMCFPYICARTSLNFANYRAHTSLFRSPPVAPYQPNPLSPPLSTLVRSKQGRPWLRQQCFSSSCRLQTEK